MKTWFEKGELAWQKHVCNKLTRKVDFANGEEPSLDIDPDRCVWGGDIVEDNESRLSPLSAECAKSLFQDIQNVCNHSRIVDWRIYGCHRKNIDLNGDLNQIEYVLHTVDGIIFLSLSNLSYISERGYILASYTIRDSDENRNIIDAKGEVAFPCDDRGRALYDILHAKSRTMYIEKIVDDKYEAFGIWNFVRHIFSQIRKTLTQLEYQYEVRHQRSGRDGIIFPSCSKSEYYIEASGFDFLQEVNAGDFAIYTQKSRSLIASGCKRSGKYKFTWYEKQ